LPWVLCWISVGLLMSGIVWRIAFPDAADDGAFYVAVSVLGFLLVPLVGALIATRLPTNAYGWVWCALGLDYGLLAFSDGLGRTGAVPSWFTGMLAFSAYVAFLCLLVFLVLLFPTGQLPGRRWRWPAWGAVVVAGLGILGLPFSPSMLDNHPTPWALGGRAGEILDDLLRPGLTLQFLFVVLAAGSVLVRFRRAGPAERQQLKWFLLAAALIAASIVWDVLGGAVNGPVWAIVDAITFALLPVAVAIAVLRYRLYELDRIVSRTVSYGLLSASLIGLYLVVVAVLRPLLEPLTGSSSLAVAASTLAVAAAFNPVRRRLQSAVDRRFDRGRYDAARAVQAFAARLRTQVDLDQVTEGLRDTVAATVAPTRVAVWLRAPSRTGGT
jgi:hypothetical protein